MMNKNLNKYADRIVNAFLKNKIISPLPKKFTKKFLTLKNLENYVKAKSKNRLVVLKQLELAFQC